MAYFNYTFFLDARAPAATNKAGAPEAGTHAQALLERPGAVAALAVSAGNPGLAFKEFVDSVYADTRLDAKTRELVFLGVQTALNFETGVRAHIPRAFAAGASRDEIVATMMVAVVNGGVGGALRFVPLIEEFAAKRDERGSIQP